MKFDILQTENIENIQLLTVLCMSSHFSRIDRLTIWQDKQQSQLKKTRVHKKSPFRHLLHITSNYTTSILFHQVTSWSIGSLCLSGSLILNSFDEPLAQVEQNLHNLLGLTNSCVSLWIDSVHSVGQSGHLFFGWLNDSEVRQFAVPNQLCSCWHVLLRWLTWMSATSNPWPHWQVWRQVRGMEMTFADRIPQL